MQIATTADGGTVLVQMTAKESEILGLVLANEGVGEVESESWSTGMAESIIELGPGALFWDRSDITYEEALSFVVDFLEGLGGFKRAVDIGREALGEKD